MMRILIVALLLVAACHKEPKGGVAARPPLPPAPLWAKAPAGTAGGVVLRAGAFPRLLARFNAILAAIEKLPAAEKDVADMREEARKEAGFDVFSLEGWKSTGLDVNGAAALFHLDRGVTVFLLPVTDRARFATSFPDLTCQEAHGSYVCSDEASALPGYAPKGGLPEVPADLRNDVEAWMVQHEDNADVFEELGKVGQFDAVVITGGSDDKHTRVQAWIRGKPGAPEMPDMPPTEAPASLVGRTAGATTLIRAHLAPAWLAARAPAPDAFPFAASVASLMQNTTGHFQIAMGSQPVPYVSYLTTVTDKDKVRTSVGALCNIIGMAAAQPQFAQHAKYQSEQTGCNGQIDVGKATGKPNVPALHSRFWTEDDVVALVIAQGPVPALRGKAKPPATGPVSAMVWSSALARDVGAWRWLTPDAAPEQGAPDPIAVMGGLVKELLVTFRMDTQGLRSDLLVTH